MRSYERAEQLAARSLELEPDAAFAHWMRALALQFMGKHDEAIRYAERGAEVGERQPVLLTALGQVYAGAGRVADAERILAELEARSKEQYIAAPYFLDVYAALGRRDEACAALERAFAEGNGLIVRIACSAEYDLVRDDPRFQAILAKMNLG
jgi:tetratricopeptide (TPR) repeat protein